MWKSWCSTMTEAVFNKEKAIGVISGTKDCKGKILSFNFVYNLILSDPGILSTRPDRLW